VLEKWPFWCSLHKDQGLDIDMSVILTQVMNFSPLCKVCVRGHVFHVIYLCVRKALFQE
jgi:hypothetical protein